MKKIKVVQIGVGHDHAPSSIQSMREQTDCFEFVGYAVPECEKGRFEKTMDNYRGAREMSVDEALNYPGLDAAVIETEELNSVKYAQMAVDRGLHIHMDKPGSADSNEFEKLVLSAKSKKLAFHMGYMYRYNPAIVKLMGDIKKGRLGEIYSVETQMSCLHEKEKRQWLSRFPGGMMFFLGCHLVDIILTIQGEPEEIIPLNTATKMDGVDAEDYGMAIFKYKNGISFAKTCAAETGGFQRRQIVVCGTRGTVELKPTEFYDEKYVMHTGISEVYDTDVAGKGWSDCRKISQSEGASRYDGMMRDFAEVLNGKTNPYTYEYEIKLHRILMQACGVK